MTSSSGTGTPVAPNMDQDRSGAPASSSPTAEHPQKNVTGYCEPWSLRAGESIALMASSHVPGPASISVVRISCGDPTRFGPGYAEEQVDLPGLGAAATIDLKEQPLVPGSYASVDLNGLSLTGRFELAFALYLTRPGEPQLVASLIGKSMIAQIVAENGILKAKAGGADLMLRTAPLATHRWYRVSVTCDLSNGTMGGRISSAPSASPGRDLLEPATAPVSTRVTVTPSKLVSLVFGSDSAETNAGGRLDGRIADPRLTVDGSEMWWDLAKEMDGPAMAEGSNTNRPGILHQLPARAVTGPEWTGDHQRWTDDPSQWNAVHFHKDDLYDAGWNRTMTLRLPPALPSGIYAFRIETQHGDDRIPFFVRPATGAKTADVALLMSSATYLAYANHRMLFEGADFITTRARLRPEHEYIRRNPQVGRSMYEKHPDGSGVMFSSRRRPTLNLRPGADGWNFTPDTDINAFLEQHLSANSGGSRRVENDGQTHDIIADEDVHGEGISALAPYRVIVTGTHPEYWSTTMLDALEEWQRGGGRLMYLGGNGFYWRVAFSDKWPGAMELRRAEDGVRNWQTGAGESYHAFSGEYGGMWRRLGRAPNELVGVGFAAQGFARASHYDINEESLDATSASGRASWIWDGVEIENGRIGTSGLGGGAAGQELDRYDTRLGSPAHAVILASATEFGPDMLRTKEEFEGSVAFPTPDPYVRSDIVFYETPNGGAVFSVGSISWFGALARNNYNNDVAKMTGNVLDRFLDQTPFEIAAQDQCPKSWDTCH